MSVDHSQVQESYENNEDFGGYDQSQPETRTSLIVNYLPQSVKEQDFVDLFASIGPLRSSKLMYDRETGYSFGYGFVEYESPEDANKAIESFNGYQMQHKRLKVAYSRPNTAETKNTTLYIRNVPDDFTDDTLYSLVEPHGEIIQARCIKNSETGKTRGIAFVIMSTKSAANAVIDALDGYTPEGARQSLNVKLADMNNSKKMIRYSRGNTGADSTTDDSWRQGMFGIVPLGIPQTLNSLLPPPIEAGIQNELFGESVNPWLQRQQDPYCNWIPYFGNASSCGGFVQPGIGYGNSFGINGNALPCYETAAFPSYVGPPMAVDYRNRQFSALSARFSPAYAASSPYMPSTGSRSFRNTPVMASPCGFKRPRSFQSSDDRGGRSKNAPTTEASSLGTEDHLVYIYGLKPTVTQDEIYALFAPYGEVERVDLIMDNRTCLAKG